MNILEQIAKLLSKDSKRLNVSHRIKEATPSRGGHAGSNNHSRGESKTRRKMADKSRKINRRYAKRK